MMLASMAERKQPRMPLACKGTKKKRNTKRKDRNLSLSFAFECVTDSLDSCTDGRFGGGAFNGEGIG